jgi:hypothetical protein
MADPSASGWPTSSVADPVGRGPHSRRCGHGNVNVSGPGGEPYDSACRAGRHRRGGRWKGPRGACFGRRTGLEPARPPFSRLPSHATAAVACRQRLDGPASTHGSAVHLRSRADGARAPPPRHGLCALRVRVLPAPPVVSPRPSLSLWTSLSETGSPGWAPRQQPSCAHGELASSSAHDGRLTTQGQTTPGRPQMASADG